MTKVNGRDMDWEEGLDKGMTDSVLSCLRKQDVQTRKAEAESVFSKINNVFVEAV